jgi:hypothetical protein
LVEDKSSQSLDVQVVRGAPVAYKGIATNCSTWGIEYGLARCDATDVSLPSECVVWFSFCSLWSTVVLVYSMAAM